MILEGLNVLLELARPITKAMVDESVAYGWAMVTFAVLVMVEGVVVGKCVQSSFGRDDVEGGRAALIIAVVFGLVLGLLIIGSNLSYICAPTWSVVHELLP